MQSYKISFINALVLVLFGIWAYLQAANPSATALIPVFLGSLILIINPLVRKGIKVWKYVAVILTFLAFAGLFMPLTGAISRVDNMAIFRVSIMMLTSLFAFVIFIRDLGSFADRE